MALTLKMNINFPIRSVIDTCYVNIYNHYIISSTNGI